MDIATQNISLKDNFLKNQGEFTDPATGKYDKPLPSTKSLKNLSDLIRSSVLKQTPTTKLYTASLSGNASSSTSTIETMTDTTLFTTNFNWSVNNESYTLYDYSASSTEDEFLEDMTSDSPLEAENMTMYTENFNLMNSSEFLEATRATVIDFVTNTTVSTPMTSTSRSAMTPSVTPESKRYESPPTPAPDVTSTLATTTSSTTTSTTSSTTLGTTAQTSQTTSLSPKLQTNATADSLRQLTINIKRNVSSGMYVAYDFNLWTGKRYNTCMFLFRL